MNSDRSLYLLSDDPAAAADYWAMRRQSGTMTPDEARAFAAWLAASDENRSALAELERVLGAVDLNGETLLAEEFERQIADAAGADSPRARSPMIRIAASVAALAAISAAAFFAIRAGGPPAAQDIIAYETAIGESETVLLADGSEAQLNTASRITVHYSKGERRVDLLSGQAFFDVDKDQSRPFVVQTANAAITVTGTSFDVLSEGGRSAVHVVTGAVDVKPQFGPTSTLLAGDMIEIDGEGRASAVARFDPSLILAWRGGKARFRDEPLGEVVASLNRYFSTPITLEDEALAELPVTGEFDVRDRETAVKALALIFGLEATDEPARTVLGAPEPQ